MMSHDHDIKLQEFISELSGFAQTAEETLKKIESDMMANKSEFSVFSERMFTIRGTAQQLGLPKIAEIAGLGEEIAIKGSAAEKNSQVRKCVGSLWDALTTVKYLLQNPKIETGEEQEILVNRLQATLKAFGGARETISADEIEKLLRGE
jgi:hypothetical protein